MGALHLCLILTLSLITVSSKAHNITDMLAPFPEYSLFNSYLTQTKLADDINSRQTITVLVLDNGETTILVAKHPLSVIKKALAVHVLLDYFDAQKLHQISHGSIISTTLLQTTGNAPGQLGFVNITDLKGGKVGFGSAGPGSPLNATYTKSVKQVPYNISVMEISQPIVVAAVLDDPAGSAADVNMTAVLEKAGCRKFAGLIVSTGVIKLYTAALERGLTVFAPNDEAFKAPGMPDLRRLTNAEVVSLLQYHAVPTYAPMATLKTSKGPIATLAKNGAGKFDLNVSTAGDSVTLRSGVDSSRIAATLIDTTPLVIFSIDSVLLPTELFSASPSPALAPRPVKPPVPSPAPVFIPVPAYSPPAPPMSSSEGAPAEGPSPDADDGSKKNAAGEVKAPALLKGVVTVSVSVIIAVLLS